jgi:ribosomal protein S18 acetylase RimI-like enzyme
MVINVSKVNPENLAKLQLISRQTFFETFAAVNTEADMNHYLQTNLSIAQLQKELAHPHSTFYFAEVNNEVVGYLKLNTLTAQTEQRGEHYVEIERIYVLQSHQGMNIGKTLFNHTLEIAHNQNMHTVWLGVWEHNTKAIAFYKRLGFEPFGKHSFFLGKDEQIDILMELKM